MFKSGPLCKLRTEVLTWKWTRAVPRVGESWASPLASFSSSDTLSFLYPSVPKHRCACPFSKTPLRPVWEILFISLFWPCWAAFMTFVPQPGIEPRVVATEASSPNHWTAREFPGGCFISCFHLLPSFSPLLQPSLSLSTPLRLAVPSSRMFSSPQS